jgi:hypothetical protein
MVSFAESAKQLPNLFGGSESISMPIDQIDLGLTNIDSRADKGSVVWMMLSTILFSVDILLILYWDNVLNFIADMWDISLLNTVIYFSMIAFTILIGLDIYPRKRLKMADAAIMNLYNSMRMGFIPALKWCFTVSNRDICGIYNNVLLGYFYSLLVLCQIQCRNFVFPNAVGGLFCPKHFAYFLLLFIPYFIFDLVDYIGTKSIFIRQYSRTIYLLLLICGTYSLNIFGLKEMAMPCLISFLIFYTTYNAHRSLCNPFISPNTLRFHWITIITITSPYLILKLFSRLLPPIFLSPAALLIKTGIKLRATSIIRHVGLIGIVTVSMINWFISR